MHHERALVQKVYTCKQSNEKIIHIKSYLFKRDKLMENYQIMAKLFYFSTSLPCHNTQALAHRFQWLRRELCDL